jgi:hypothetical protein
MKNVVDIMNTQMPRIINIGTVWANGQPGEFHYFTDYTLRFRELTDERLERYVEGDNWAEHALIVAQGFVAYLIVSTQNSSNYKTSDIYANYYQYLCNAYKEIEGKKPDAFNRNLDKEFYEKHIADEHEKVRLSQGIFDFLTSEDKDNINKHVDCYFEYIKRFAAKWVTNEMDKSFEELWGMAKKYDLIPVPHYSGNHEIDMMMHESLISLNFTVWLQREYNNIIEGQYTFDNFKQFLKDWNMRIALVERQFEEEKLKHKNDVAPELNPDTNENIGNPKQYTLDIEKITKVYNFCVNTEVIDGTIISNVDFINAVNNADFRVIYTHAEQQKTKGKCKYIIYVLSKFVNDKWYLNTARSIDIEPNRCSGINVPLDWRKKANAIR